MKQRLNRQRTDLREADGQQPTDVYFNILPEEMEQLSKLFIFLSGPIPPRQGHSLVCCSEGVYEQHYVGNRGPIQSLLRSRGGLSVSISGV